MSKSFVILCNNWRSALILCWLTQHIRGWSVFVFFIQLQVMIILLFINPPIHFLIKLIIVKFLEILTEFLTPSVLPLTLSFILTHNPKPKEFVSDNLLISDRKLFVYELICSWRRQSFLKGVCHEPCFMLCKKKRRNNVHFELCVNRVSNNNNLNTLCNLQTQNGSSGFELICINILWPCWVLNA